VIKRIDDLTREHEIGGKILVITSRTNDYHCCLKGFPKMWECGRSPGDAVYQFLITYGHIF
jgi:hypothetical protein